MLVTGGLALAGFVLVPSLLGPTDQAGTGLAPASGEASSAAPSGIPTVVAPPSASPTSTRPPRRPAVPTALVVPALEIDAPVVPIFVQDGTLVPPADPQQVGWWAEGKKVGAAHGGAVITGHTVHTGGGAMDRLKTLVAGDRVAVRTPRGLLTYRVQSVTYFAKDELAKHAAELFDRSGRHRLVLVTCDEWDGTSYEGNTVVIAQRVA